ENTCYLKGDNTRMNGKLIGNGNFNQCYNDLINSNLIDTTKCFNNNNNNNNNNIKLLCSPNNIIIPKISSNINFYFIENFYYTANALSIDNMDGSQFLNILKQKGNEYCKLNFNNVIHF